MDEFGTSEKHPRLHDLLAAIGSGGLSAAQQQELIELLQDDADAQQQFVEQVTIHAWLQWQVVPQGAPLSVSKAEGEKGTEAEGTEAEGRTHEGAGLRPARGARASWDRFLARHDIGAGVVAAALFLVGVLVWSAVTYLPGVATKDEQADTKTKHIALLSGRNDVVWLDGTRPAVNKPRLMPGQRLAFASGMIEIEYVTGARVVIEGPAEFVVGRKEAGRHKGTKAQDKGIARSSSPHPQSLNPNSSSSNSGFLKSGKLTARVDTAAAKGFTVETPTGSVEDLGTEFAVDVNGQGEATVHVRKGRVRARSSGSKKHAARTVELSAGESLEIGAETVVAKTPAALAKRFAVLDRKWKPTASSLIRGVRVYEVSSELVAEFGRAAIHAVDGSGLVGPRHVDRPGDPRSPGTMWLTVGGHDEPNSSLPESIVFDLGEHYDVSRVHIWNYNESVNNLTSRGAKDVAISVSASKEPKSFKKIARADDKSTFVFPRAAGTPQYRGFDLDLQKVAKPELLKNVRYVRFDIKSNHGPNSSDTDPGCVGLSEVQFFGSFSDVAKP